MDKKKITALILIDLSKAFDSTDHDRLLYKISATVYGHVIGYIKVVQDLFVRPLSSNSYWIYSCTLSDAVPITHGVPQGAILSPLLFCIYLNDLPNAPKEWHLESYIEVSKLFLSFPLASTNSSLKKLKDDFPKVTTWCGENHLLTTQTRQRLCFWEPRNSWAGCLLRVAKQCHSLAIRLTSAKDRGVI